MECEFFPLQILFRLQLAFSHSSHLTKTSYIPLTEGKTEILESLDLGMEREGKGRDREEREVEGKD